MIEAKKGLGQRDVKGATKYCFLFDSLFDSKVLAESMNGCW